MAATWPGAVSTAANLYTTVNLLQTTLSGTINSVVTTIALTSTSGFPTAGAVTIDNEVIFYTNISGGNLTGCTRGSDGTTAASHNSGVPVGATVVAYHVNALNAEVIAVESFLSSLVGRTSTQIQAPDGASVSVPSISFASDPDTGFMHTTANTIDIVTGGVLRSQFTGGVLQKSASGSLTIWADDGDAANPAFSFKSDQNTGIFSVSADALGFTTGGTIRMNLTTTELRSTVNIVAAGSTSNLGSTSDSWAHIYTGDGAVGTPSHTFGSDPASGMYRRTSNTVSFAVGGVEQAELTLGGFESFNNALFDKQVSVTGGSSIAGAASKALVNINDSQEVGTDLSISHGHFVISPTTGGDAGWMALAREDALGFHMGNQIGFTLYANSQTITTTYSARDTSARYFTMNSNPFGTGNMPVPGTTFTVSGTTFTVRAYRNANNRLFVYEDVSATAASGTLTSIVYSTQGFGLNANLQSLFQDGTAPLPGMSFFNDGDTGIRRGGANDIIIVAGGADQLEISTTKAIFSGLLLAPDGGSGSPSFSFGADQNTGMYRVGTDDMALVTAGVKRVEIDANGRVYSDQGATLGSGAAGAGFGKLIASGTTAATTFQIDAPNGESGLIFVQIKNNPNSSTNAYLFDQVNMASNGNGTLASSGKALINSLLGGTGGTPSYTMTLTTSGNNLHTYTFTPTNSTAYKIYFLKIC